MAARKPRQGTPAEPTGPMCAVAGCDRPVHARGRCEPHYEDLARGRNRAEPSEPSEPPEPAGPVCSARGCDESVVHARNLCKTHYEDWYGRDAGAGSGHPSPLVTGEPDR